MTPSQDQPGTDVEVRELSPELQRRFAEMAMTVPEDDGTGQERILEQILSAATWEQLDDPWDTAKANDLAGKLLRLEGITRFASDFRSGLRIFLAVQYTDVESGERSVFASGSVSIVGQLVRAYCLKLFPLYAELVISERATADGYHPHHLVFRGSDARQGAAEPASGS